MPATTAAELARLAELLATTTGADHDAIARQAQELADRDPAVAWDRAETDPCERGTVGCSVLHTADTECQTW